MRRCSARPGYRRPRGVPHPRRPLRSTRLRARALGQDQLQAALRRRPRGPRRRARPGALRGAGTCSTPTPARRSGASSSESVTTSTRSGGSGVRGERAGERRLHPPGLDAQGDDHGARRPALDRLLDERRPVHGQARDEWGGLARRARRASRGTCASGCTRPAGLGRRGGELLQPGAASGAPLAGRSSREASRPSARARPASSRPPAPPSSAGPGRGPARRRRSARSGLGPPGRRSGAASARRARARRSGSARGRRCSPPPRPRASNARK